MFELLERRPELRLDGSRPTSADLTERLRRFWLPEEVVLSIGLTETSLQRRVRPGGTREPRQGRRPPPMA